jgi:hypothetical protein
MEVKNSLAPATTRAERLVLLSCRSLARMSFAVYLRSSNSPPRGRENKSMTIVALTCLAAHRAGWCAVRREAGRFGDFDSGSSRLHESFRCRFSDHQRHRDQRMLRLAARDTIADELQLVFATRCNAAVINHAERHGEVVDRYDISKNSASQSMQRRCIIPLNNFTGRSRVAADCPQSKQTEEEARVIQVDS